MTPKETRRREAKKRRREARKRGENVQKRSRIRWNILTPPGPRIVKMCWECAGTGTDYYTTKPHYRPCADCNGLGGTISDTYP